MSTPFFLTTVVVSVAVLAYFWFVEMALLRRDNFRSDVRRIRDELFDFMWQNGFGFENMAYQDARQFLNGMLRLSNQFSPAMFLLSVFYFKWYNIEAKAGLSFDGCPKELKAKLESAYERAVRRLLAFMFAEGTCGLALRVVVFACRNSYRWMQATNQLVRDIHALGAPADQLTLAQRSLLRC